MTLKDLKGAAAARKDERSESAEKPQPASKEPLSERTKMLGGRVPLAVHREFQTQIFRGQEEVPELNIQVALPALVRLLRDETVWRKFIAELKRG